MNREIKFRGKSTLNEKWVYGFYYTKILNHAGNIKKEHHFIFDLLGREYDVIPETVGQYTGLNDEKNNKIYEGDLLEFAFVDIDGERYSSIYKVVFRNGCFMSKFLSQIVLEYEILSEFLINGKNETLEVIGNIYDNSELLKYRGRK